MIQIEYLNDLAYGEPGPNLVWRGCPDDFLRLLNELHVLGKQNGVECEIADREYVQPGQFSTITARSSLGGNRLLRITERSIVIDVDCQFWREIAGFLLSVSFFPSHSYVDLNESVIEDANLIISSEW